jgi:hypothetical protein
MKDAIRAVILVMGFFGVLFWTGGLPKGEWSRTERVAGRSGLALIALALVMRPGKRKPQPSADRGAAARNG